MTTTAVTASDRNELRARVSAKLLAYIQGVESVEGVGQIETLRAIAGEAGIEIDQLDAESTEEAVHAVVRFVRFHFPERLTALEAAVDMHVRQGEQEGIQ